MKLSKVLLALPLAGAVMLGSGCEPSKSQRTSAIPSAQASAPTLTAPPPPQPSAVPVPQPKAPQAQQDPVVATIARAEAAYGKGQANYRAGHLEAAKNDFDAAFDVLLQGAVGVHDDERLEREFDKIVEAVHDLEMVAYKMGDGFTEQRPEPAPIDEANEVTFPVDANVRAKAEEELRMTRSDLPLMMNDQVASFISYFSSRGRGTLERALSRSGRYREMIQRVFKEEGVPQDLIFLAQAESGFHPLALSKAGARGMWQFMASRASGYGLERNWWVDERQDPEKATRAAARHLKDLYNQFGDWYLAMAAYNSGPGTVQRAVQRTGYADFWELYRRNVLPGETRNYVPIIVAMTIMAKNPTQYGLENVVPERPLDADRVKIDYPVDLRLVAECVDASVASLQELNPSLLRMTTPKDQQFELKLPAGTAEKFQQAIATIPAEMRVLWRYHRVQTGETLGQVAQKYRTTTKAIAEVNNLDQDAELAKNSKLIIPMTATRKVEETETAAFSKHATRYKVRKGDTVLSVADDYGVPVEKLRKWNHLKGNALKAGRTLTIYRPVAEADAAETASAGRRSSKGSKTAAKRHGKAEVAEEEDAPKSRKAKASAPRKHKVRSGETLTSIASEHNTTVAQLKKDNKGLGSRVKAGQVLVIK